MSYGTVHLHPVLGLLAADGPVALLSFNPDDPAATWRKALPRTRAAMTSAKLLVDAFSRIRWTVGITLTPALSAVLMS